jgi:Domain of unknown function (DUF4136)
MRSSKIGITLGIILSLAVVARADQVTADRDHAVNFSQYKTYMWIQKPKSEEPFMADRIAAAVTTQLRLKGFREVNEGADMAVGANLATEEQPVWETYYDGSGWGWGGGWATTKVKTYEVGTITVDLFDARSKNIIWQGVATDKVSSHPQKRIRETDKQIEKMFKNFPMGPQ